jgi:hypothetical protein
LPTPNVTFLFLFVKPPFHVGIYDKSGSLTEMITTEEGKASDVLPVLISSLLDKYEPIELIYANGPGNNMSIKICYVCLRSLSIVKNIPLKSASSFEFNNHGLIELTNKRFFCFENDKISLIHLEYSSESEIFLPKTLENIVFSAVAEPFYLLPPV